MWLRGWVSVGDGPRPAPGREWTETNLTNIGTKQTKRSPTRNLVGSQAPTSLV